MSGRVTFPNVGIQKRFMKARVVQTRCVQVLQELHHLDIILCKFYFVVQYSSVTAMT